MNKKISTGAGIAVIVAVVGLAVAALVWFGQEPQAQTQVQTTQVNSPKSQVVNQSQATKSAGIERWKTYKNTKYGFELNYPNTWETIANDTGDGEFESFQLKIKKIGDQELYEKTSNKFWVGYNPYFQVVVYKTGFSDVAKMIANEKKNAEAGIGAYADIVKTTSVNGVKAIWLANCIEGTNQQGPIMVKNGLRYELSLPLKCIATEGPGKPEDPALVSFYNEIDARYKDALNKIFTSFKFTK